jgi:hypothetical protein
VEHYAAPVVRVGLAPDQVVGQEAVDEGGGRGLVGADAFRELAQGAARRFDQGEDGGGLASGKL